MPFHDSPMGTTHHHEDSCFKCPECSAHYDSREEFMQYPHNCTDYRKHSDDEEKELENKLLGDGPRIKIVKAPDGYLITGTETTSDMKEIIIYFKKI
jgi:hypothetical protein